jgi:hypothetical protein
VLGAAGEVISSGSRASHAVNTSALQVAISNLGSSGLGRREFQFNSMDKFSS